MAAGTQGLCSHCLLGGGQLLFCTNSFSFFLVFTFILPLFSLDGFFLLSAFFVLFCFVVVGFFIIQLFLSQPTSFYTFTLLILYTTHLEGMGAANEKLLGV